MPENARNVALTVLVVIAILAVLRWASGFFIPLMLGLVFSYALSPVVDWLQARKVPRALSAAVLILGILGGTGGSVYALADDANELIASLPDAARKVRDVLRKPKKEASTLETVQQAATELQKATEGAPAGGTPRGVQRVIVEKPRFDLRDHLWTGTIGLANVVGQTVIITFLTYFLLLSGDTFRRKLVKIAGPGLAEKKLTVQALDEINAQMQRYLLVQLVASVAVGVCTGIAFALLGLNHAAVWGVAAGVLNLVPYVGSVVVTGGAALVAFLQFNGSVNMALAVAGVSLLINTIEGNLLVPLATSRASSMNPVAVFIGVLAWGWLWGVWGLLLGIPILMAVKAVCDRVDHLKPIGELLGN
ncbi:AI-2E family transporter [Ramlibacter sp. USB13]|uniref:AI-2E family transporter n=2 Tax=Ramlibacter cellulosilyticus TaxID=2764187 RepID=A0A923MMV1_9BURK|nr:AI-2E family transporter [Ramlibacter cellulosilyticus]MBC5781950.1 AI-2E family transporter [Ramlibacter cellulosilyticus]